MKTSIALVMIVRDEAMRLANCLDSVEELVNEIVIVDTGSMDNTVDIARQYTEKVFYYTWDDDFSAARNFAIEQANSEWILSLDADERMDTTGGDLRALVEQYEKEAYCLPLHLVEESCSCQYNRFMVLRLFKKTYRFRGAIHEQIMIENPDALSFAASPIIWHATIPDKERKIRRGRNITLLFDALKKEPDNPFLLYYCGVDWLGLGQMDKAIPCFERVLCCLTDQHLLFRAPAIRYLIACYKAQGELDQAICLCLDECMRYPEYGDLYFEGGVLFEIKGEFQIAAKWFNQALQHGKPSAVFHHTDGIESYLSLHHLGYCLEKQGFYKQARECWMRALDVNKRYVPPLYQLMLLELAHNSAAVVWEDMRRSGYLDEPSCAASTAEFFWEAGFPNLAYACLAESDLNTLEPLEPLIKYGIYSGHIDKAFSIIDMLRCNSQKLSVELAIDETVGLLLMKDLETAKERVLGLWRRLEGRNAAWAMLNLIHMIDQGDACGAPEPSREEAVRQVLMDVLEKCWRSRVVNVQMQDSLANLMTKIMDLLLLQPQSSLLLVSYLNEKSNAIAQTLHYNFEALKGLYV